MTTVRVISSANSATTTNAILTIGGVSAAFSVITQAGTAPDQLPLALTITGSGGGSVSGGVSCASGRDCAPVNLPAGTVVTLYASPDTVSTFGGWSGSCTHAAPTCSFTISKAASVTATFTAAPKAMVRSKGFSSLQAAYSDDGTLNNAVIKLLEGNLFGDFVADRNIAVTIVGGHNAAYSSNSASTRIRGAVRLGAGTTRVKGVTGAQ